MGMPSDARAGDRQPDVLIDAADGRVFLSSCAVSRPPQVERMAAELCCFDCSPQFLLADERTTPPPSCSPAGSRAGC